PPLIATGIVLGLAGLPVMVWWSLERLQARTSDGSVASLLALTCAVAGVAVMQTGSLSGGQACLSLAGALAGAALACGLWATENGHRCCGVGVIGLFSIVFQGHF